jgi:hypothetical protein
MTLKEDALGNASVNNTRLNYVEGVILEIIVYDALADAVVLIGIFNYWFLEVAFKLEYLQRKVSLGGYEI